MPVTKLAMLASLILLAVARNAVAQETPEDRLILAKGFPYTVCISREFGKLTTPDYADQDIFPLRHIPDEAVFETMKPGCRAEREKLLGDLSGSEAASEAMNRLDARYAERYARNARESRQRLGAIAAAIQVPGPRAAVPLIEAFTEQDIPGSALRKGKDATSTTTVTTASFTIDEVGRVLDCSASGPSEILGKALCQVAIRRWRYAPAIDVKGQPVSDTRSKTVSFKITG